MAGNRVPRVALLAGIDPSSACAVLRTCGPLQRLEESGIIELKRIDNREPPEVAVKTLQTSDLVVVQRESGFKLPYSYLTRLINRNCTKVVYEFDDAFWAIPLERRQIPLYVNLEAPLTEYLKKSDAISVSTLKLKEYCDALGGNATHIPNTCDERIWFGSANFTPPPDKFRILFSGTMTHDEDLKMLEPVFKSVLDKLGASVEFVLWGNSLEWIPRSQVQRIDFDSDYFRYAEKLQELSVSCAVVPLLDTEFNQAKSHIKWIEYSACGIPGVFSKVGCYPSYIRDYETGILADNSPDSWLRAILWLHTNPERGRRIGEVARDEVRQRHALSKSIGAWEKFILSVLS